MSRKTSAIEQLLNITSRRELQEKSGNWSAELLLPQAQKLTRHLQTLEAVQHTFKMGIIHTYTSDLLNPWLDFYAAVQGVDLSVYHAPYGMNLMEAQADSVLAKYKPDLILFMLQREDLHPELRKPVTNMNNEQRLNLCQESVQRLVNILVQFRQNLSGRFLVTILPSLFKPGLGLYDSQSEHSEAAWWAMFKSEAAEKLNQQLESVMLMDLDDVLAQTGRNNFFDLRYWYTSRFPFKAQAVNEFSRRILDVICLDLTAKAKVIVLDADNTLWGGIIGEDGPNGISLGPDYPGNVFIDFQRRILDYQERGFILALCSKNNHQDVLEILQDHPHQILKESHFSSMRINWLPKYENIISIAKELNLGLDSFIFVDDSDYECAMVRRELPQVEVIQVPAKAVEIPHCLEQQSRLEILSLTQEDKDKTLMYAQERQRQNLQQEITTEGGGIDGYLRSLNMKMTIELNASSRISRLSQLSQKTNQFNLTTRRYSEQQIQQFIDSDNYLVASFSLSDSFGDSGVVGLAIIHYKDNIQVEIDTFLMSCRVIGRKAESAFIEALMSYFANRGIYSVTAEYIPSLKNELVSMFYKDHGFLQKENGRYFRTLKDVPPVSSEQYPIEIQFIEK